MGPASWKSCLRSFVLLMVVITTSFLQQECSSARLSPFQSNLNGLYLAPFFLSSTFQLPQCTLLDRSLSFLAGGESEKARSRHQLPIPRHVLYNTLFLSSTASHYNIRWLSDFVIENGQSAIDVATSALRKDLRCIRILQAFTAVPQPATSSRNQGQVIIDRHHPLGLVSISIISNPSLRSATRHSLSRHNGKRRKSKPAPSTTRVTTRTPTTKKVVRRKPRQISLQRRLWGSRYR